MVVSTRNRNSKEESRSKRLRKPNSRYLDVDTEFIESKRKDNCKSNSCKSLISKNNILYNRILYPSDKWDIKYREKHLPTLFIEQKNRCKLCLHKIKNKESIIVDHIVQKQYCTIYSQPKIDQISNLQALCSYCNSIKTNIVDKKINKLMEENDIRTRTYDGLRSYTMNLLNKTYRIEQESLAKVKETNQDMNSEDDSEDESEDESDKKSVEKVFSTLQNVSNKDSMEEDSMEEDDLDDFINNSESKSKSKSEDNELISKKKEVTRVTRSKTGSLPKKIEIQKPNVIITKSKESDSRNSVKRKIDYEEVHEEEIMIPKKVQKEETSQIISKKKDGKFISLIFRNCNFNNCTISL
jgi:5-methylcytosine-specific restriction endonuclease McrA